MSPTDKVKAYLGNNKYIFVSYSHKDVDRVYELIKILQSKYNVWFDEGLHYGREWDEEIVTKIDGCSLFIYVISNNSLESKNCKDEIAYAKQNNIPFINILLDNIELPNIFSFRYGRFQMCKYFEYVDKSEILEDLDRRSDEIKLTLKDSYKKVDIKPVVEKVTQKPAITKASSDDHYSLFVFEKEITIFALDKNQTDRAIFEKDYLDDGGDHLYQIVLLPGDNLKDPVQKVEITFVKMVGLVDYRPDSTLLALTCEQGYDAKYSYNVLDRGYNCINFNIRTRKDLPRLFSSNKSRLEKIKLYARIYSIFGTYLDVKYEIFIDGEVDVSNNPDVKKIPSLKSFKVHHCHYEVVKK